MFLTALVLACVASSALGVYLGRRFAFGDMGGLQRAYDAMAAARAEGGEEIRALREEVRTLQEEVRRLKDELSTEKATLRHLRANLATVSMLARDLDPAR